MSECQRLLDDTGTAETATESVRVRPSRRADVTIAWAAAAILCVTALGMGWVRYEGRRRADLYAQAATADVRIDGTARRAEDAKGAISDLKTRLDVNERTTKGLDDLLRRQQPRDASPPVASGRTP